jgi:hypothetical protein
MKWQLAAAGALVALVAGCASDDYRYSDTYYPYYTSYQSYPSTRYYPVDTRVSAIEVIPSTATAPVIVNPAPLAPGELYRVTVRNPDGSLSTYVMSSLGTLRVGDKVRVSNGTIYPVG